MFLTDKKEYVVSYFESLSVFHMIVQEISHNSVKNAYKIDLF